MANCPICLAELKGINTAYLERSKTATGEILCEECFIKVLKRSSSEVINVNKMTLAEVVSTLEKPVEIRQVAANKGSIERHDERIGCLIAATLFISVLLFFIIRGCFNDNRQGERETVAKSPNPILPSNEKMIYKKDYKYWPFTVDKGILRCVPLEEIYLKTGYRISAIVFIAKGKTYAVNGTAQNFAADYGYSNMNEIVDVGDVGDIIQDGIKLCK